MATRNQFGRIIVLLTCGWLFGLTGCGSSSGSSSPTANTTSAGTISSLLGGVTLRSTGTSLSPLVGTSGSTTTIGFSGIAIQSLSIYQPQYWPSSPTLTLFPNSSATGLLNGPGIGVIYSVFGSATQAPSVRSVFALTSNYVSSSTVTCIPTMALTAATTTPIIYDVETTCVSTGNNSVVIPSTTTYRYVNFSSTGSSSYSTSNSLTGNSNGFYVIFDSTTGNIESVIAFGRAAQKPGVTVADSRATIHGQISAVFDRDGKNLAPSGAITVELDAQTAKILFIR